MKKNYKSNVWKIYFFSFIGSLHFTAAVLIPFFLDWGEISFFQIMILQSIFTISLFLLETPTGAIADKYGRKTSVSLGTIIGALGFLTYVIYPSFYLFILAELILALGASLISGANESLFYDTLKEVKREKESKKLIGRLSSISLLGLLISAPIGSLIASEFGVRFAIFCMIFPHIIAFCIMLTVREPKIGRKKAGEISYLNTLKRGLSFFAKHRILKIMAFDSAIVAALAFFLIWVYQYKLINLNVPIKYFGFIHALIVLVQIGVLNSFSFFEKVVNGKRRYLLISALIPGIFFVVLGLTSSIILSIISMSFIAAFGITRKMLYSSYMHKFIPSSKRATVISSISMLYALTMAINNIVMGYLVKLNMKYALIILGVAVIGFASFSRIEERHLRD